MNKAALFLFLLGSRLALAQSSLHSFASFDATAALSSLGITEECHFSAFKLLNNSIHIVYGTRKNPRRRGVLHFTTPGALTGPFTFSADLVATMAFDSNGSALVLAANPDRSMQINTYGVSGTLLSQIPLFSTRRLGLVALGTTPAVLLPDGHVVAADNVPVPFVDTVFSKFPDYYLLTALDNHTLAVVDEFSPTIYIADLSTGRTTSAIVSAPEVDQAILKSTALIDKTAPNTAKPALFLDAISNGKGGLFIAVGGQSVSSGMCLIEVDRSGKRIRTLHLLPVTSQHSIRDGNLDGTLLQTRLSAADAMLATISVEGIITLFRNQTE